MGSGYSVEKFFVKASTDYLADKLFNGDINIVDQKAFTNKLYEAIIAQRKSRIDNMSKDRARWYWNMVSHCYLDDVSSHEIFTDILGDDWFYDIPQKVNPKYLYVQRIVEVIKQALNDIGYSYD